MNQFLIFLRRIVLFPFALLFGAVIAVRHFLYSVGMLKSIKLDIPVISVGNLSFGGTGKTPHVLYLLQLLEPYLEVSVLSRGYGRKTEGFGWVDTNSTSDQVGDEPLLIKKKFEQVPVAVSENRVFAIPKLFSQTPNLQLILLDDAFQHLAITPSLNILLTEYDDPFFRDWLFPSGRLRDWRMTYRNADMIVVTKCPENLTASDKQSILNQLQPFPHQQVFFSKYRYKTPYLWTNPQQTLDPSGKEIVLVTGIAKTEYLRRYLETQSKAIHRLEFADHRNYTQEDLVAISYTWETLSTPDKVFLTTEKDALRLERYQSYFAEKQMPMYVLPIDVVFDESDQPSFDEAVKQRLLEFKV